MRVNDLITILLRIQPNADVKLETSDGKTEMVRSVVLDGLGQVIITGKEKG